MDRRSAATAARRPPLFGDAFFEQGLGRTNSFEAAFAAAKARVAEREKAAGYTPPRSRSS